VQKMSLLTRLIIIIPCIYIVISLFFVLDSICDPKMNAGTGGASIGTVQSSTGTGGASRVSGTSSTSAGGTSKVSGTSSTSTGGTSKVSGTSSASDGGASRVTGTTSTGNSIDVQKYIDPLNPKKREDTQVILRVLSNPKDISSFILEDEIPEGFEFKNADPIYSKIVNSTANRSGKITWIYKYSRYNYLTANEFKYTIRINKNTDRELKPAILNAWDINSRQLRPIQSNSVKCNIPNKPPYFEILPKSPLRIFGNGIYNIRTVVRDPDNDNFTCLLIVNDKTIKPDNVNLEINEYSWNISNLSAQRQVYLKAIDEEGEESEVQSIEIKSFINPIEDIVGYLQVIAVILTAIIGAILTNKKPKVYILTSSPNSEGSFLPTNAKSIERELGSISKAIKAIGQANACMTTATIQGTKKALLESGYEGAETYAAKLIGNDQNTELIRVLIECRSHNLSPEAAILVLDNLNKIESGKW
jgi:hypothetical protein